MTESQLNAHFQRIGQSILKLAYEEIGKLPLTDGEKIDFYKKLLHSLAASAAEAANERASKEHFFVVGRVPV